jgi:hypothetical protein
MMISLLKGSRPIHHHPRRRKSQKNGAGSNNLHPRICLTASRTTSRKCWPLCTTFACLLTITKAREMYAWSKSNRKSLAPSEPKMALTTSVRFVGTSLPPARMDSRLSMPFKQLWQESPLFQLPLQATHPNPSAG